MGEIVLDGVTKRFDDSDSEIVAVNDLSIQIEDGEFIVLVGPSGCGKTTSLRCVAGLEDVTEGDIRVDGESIVDKKAKDRDMAMVFQNYALYPHMTARQNMAFGLKMTTDLPDEEINERVEEAAEMMGITDQLDKHPEDLSGGQQQRVALGRAIVRDPEAFLMDEPLSNLDAKLRTEMRTEIQELHNELQVTTIYVTHNQTEAMTMGDRIAILNDGELQQFGTPLECYHNPRNLFVAEFIGSPSMNFFDISTESDRLIHDIFEYSLSTLVVPQLDDLVLGIRPEDIEVAGDSTSATVTAEATVVEPMGDITQIKFAIGDDFCTAEFDEKVASSGDDVPLLFPEENLYLFDRTTGEAIRTTGEAKEEIDTLA